MIQLEEPALALNDIRVGGKVKMSRTLLIRQDDKRENIIEAVANYAASKPGGRLRNLVLNSHGVPGYLIMGEGFWAPHTNLFKRWEGLVDNIWVMACQIASRIPLAPGSRLPDWCKGTVGDGYHFCRNMAIGAHANVIASLNTQVVPSVKIAPGSIDSFEGMLLCFKRDGEIAWSRQYGLQNRE